MNHCWSLSFQTLIDKLGEDKENLVRNCKLFEYSGSPFRSQAYCFLKCCIFLWGFSDLEDLFAFFSR